MVAGPITLPFPRDQYGTHYRVKESNKHQAKLEMRTLKWLIQRYTKPGDTILDPMSGTGSLHIGAFMGRNTVTVEIEAEFARLQHQNIEHMHDLWRNNKFYTSEMAEFENWDYTGPGTTRVIHGDARAVLPLETPVDAVIFSPPYGSLWVQPKSKSQIAKEKNYNVGYGDNPQNVGNLSNYTSYLAAMEIIYRKCYESLRPGGILVTVVKDYVKGGKRVYCSMDNVQRLVRVGFRIHEWNFRDASVQNNPYSARNKEKRIAAGKHTDELDIGREDLIALVKD